MLQSKGPWVVYSTSPIQLISFSPKVLEYNDNVWSVTENYKAGNDEEISLKKGQLVEVLVKPHGSSRWRVRLLLSEGIHPSEGWVPHNVLKRSDERDTKKKRHSDISHSSSEGESKNSEVWFVMLVCVWLSYHSVHLSPVHCSLSLRVCFKMWIWQGFIISSSSFIWSGVRKRESFWFSISTMQ